MKKAGKPYIAKILKHEGKTALLPLPPKLRELMSCVKALGIKDKADEDDLYITGYRTLYVPEPVIGINIKTNVERTAEMLAELNEEQIRAVGVLCRCFYLNFSDIIPLLSAINYKAQEENRHDNN